jgi:hypothetical protein
VIRRHAALLGVGLLAMVLRLLVGGSGLSEAESAAVQALRDGEGPTVAVPPVAVALDAVSPLGSTALTALVAGVLVIALTVLAQRLAGRPAGAAVPTAGGLALLVALTWASPLAVTVALLGFTGALLAVAGEDPPPGAVALAGFGLGLAGLARPEMALLGITVLVWAAIRPRPLRPSAFVGLVLATGISVVPWVVHVHHRTGTPGLASPLTDALTALGSVAGGPVVAGVSALALVAAAAVGVGQRQWLGDQALGLLPLLAGAVLAVGLLVGDPDVLAGYPAVPLAVVVLARSTPATITEAGPWRT